MEETTPKCSCTINGTLTRIAMNHIGFTGRVKEWSSENGANCGAKPEGIFQCPKCKTVVIE